MVHFHVHVCVCDVFMLQARAELSAMAYYMWLITFVKAVASLKKSCYAIRGQSASLNPFKSKCHSHSCTCARQISIIELGVYLFKHTFYVDQWFLLCMSSA